MQSLRATAMEQYLWHNDIKFMDYAAYVKGGEPADQKGRRGAVPSGRVAGDPLELARSGLGCHCAPDRRRARHSGRVGMHTRQRGAACQFRAPVDEHGGAQETLARSVPTSVPSAGGVDVRTDPDLVSIPHPGGVERERVAGAADAAGKLKVPASRQLFRVDRRLCAGASADEPTSADALGGVIGGPGPAVKSPARIDFCQVSAGLDRKSTRLNSSHLGISYA